MAQSTNNGESKHPVVEDEPGWDERFQRSLQRALAKPATPHKPGAKAKERPASKGRVHKGRTRS